MVEIYGSRAHAQSVKTFFFFLEITCFRQQKTSEFLISAEKPFEFWQRPFFLWRSEKPTQSRLRPTKIWVKFVYGCIKLPKKPPPLCEILVMRLP